MMKFGFALNAVAGAALVATGVGFSQGDAHSLQASLGHVMSELETLAGLRERIDRGDRDAIADVLKGSITPSADGAAEDARLDALRVEVARLEKQRDDLPPLAARPAASAKVKPAKLAKEAASDGSLTSFEAAGFSADVVKQGEVLFRADRFAECVKVLERAPADPRARYWTARALEHMDKTDEAIAIYTEIAAMKVPGWAGERATADLEFLQWKKSVAAAPAPHAQAPKKP